MAAAPRDDYPVTERLRLTEIFASLQGEADTAGWPTVFVRLTGCPLRCGYCDSTYSFYGGEWTSITAVIERVRALGPRRVCVTGGEPLAQPNVQALMSRLCDAGFAVSLETSGALDASLVDPRVVRVVDVKTPGSGEVSRNLLANIESPRASDLIKFVLTSRADYEWSRAFCRAHQLPAKAQVLFSPVDGVVEPRALAEWLLEDRLEVRLQVQLHKLLWGEAQGR
jgi:7-carboxy-7-deazaguanine synthase